MFAVLASLGICLRHNSFLFPTYYSSHDLQPHLLTLLAKHLWLGSQCYVTDIDRDLGSSPRESAASVLYCLVLTTCQI